MSSVNPKVIGPWLAPAALLLVFLCHSWYGPDVFYHLAWGRDVLTRFSLVPLRAPLLAQPIAANPYWLFQGVLYAIYALGGPYLGSALFALSWIAIAHAWASRARLFRRPTLGPWLAVVALLAVQTRFEQRPEVWSYLALAWLLVLLRDFDLERPDRGRLIKMLALQIAWTNVHGYFALGPLVVATYVFARCLRRPWPPARAVFGVPVAMLSATLASPFGWHAWGAVLGYARFGGRLNDLIQELAPPAFSLAVPPLAAFWLALALSLPLAAFVAFKRRDAFAVLLALGGAALALTAVRNLPLFFLMAAPLWAYCGDVPRRLRFVTMPLNVVVCVVFGVTFVTGAYGNAVGYLGSFGIRLEPASYPIETAAYLNADKFNGRVFNDSYDGGYLEYVAPDVVITGDSYFADVAKTREFLGAIRDPRQLAELDGRLHFDALLINVENLAVFEAVSASPAFTLAFVESHRALFRRGHSGPPRGRYYGGEDLRHWANAFGPTTWIAIARRHRDPALLVRILTDLAGAAHVPAALLGAALTFDDPARCEIARAARPLRPRAFADATLDLARLDALFARVDACAP